MRIAAADLGSNSFHLLVVQARADGSFEVLVSDKEYLRLGDEVSRTGRIGPATADAVVACLTRFKAVADGLGADELVACATSALREADGSATLIDRIADEVGLDVRVISGRDEARLIFTAVRSSIVIDPSPALCLDLGGGSLEVVVGDAGGLLWSDSVKLGVARLTAECVRHDPPKPSDLERVRTRVEAVLRPIAASVADLEPGMLVGTSGTLCDLARMAAIGAGADPAALATSVNQLQVGRAELEAVHRRLVGATSSARASMPGLEPRRADLAPAGSTLLLTAMDVFGFDRLTVGEWALREGMVLDAIAHHDPSDWTGDPRAMRGGSVLALARRCSWDEGHSTQVAQLAGELFDQTRRFHRLGSDDRELLEHAANLHDIGEHVAVEGHHKHTAYLILNGHLRGFSPAEVAILASIGRSHRRSDPKASYEPFASLGPEDRQRTIVLTALLRVADGLDRGHAGVVDGIDVEPVGDDGLRIVVRARADAELERWGVRRKAALLEKVLGRTIDVAFQDGAHPSVRLAGIG